MRALYAGFIRLHPAAFRREFGDEMLCIFDEMIAGGAGARQVIGKLLADVVFSLVRQWFLRRGLWTAVLSLAVSAMLFAVALEWSAHQPINVAKVPAGNPVTAIALINITLFSLSVITTVLIAAVAWSRQISRKRRPTCHSNCARSRNATAVLPLLKT